jgi:hypothetical protein
MKQALEKGKGREKSGNTSSNEASLNKRNANSCVLQQEKIEQASEQETLKDQPKGLPHQQVPQPDDIYTEKLEQL